MRLQNPASELTIKWSLSVQSHAAPIPQMALVRLEFLGVLSTPSHSHPQGPALASKASVGPGVGLLPTPLTRLQGEPAVAPHWTRASKLGCLLVLLFSLDTLFVNTVLCVGRDQGYLKMNLWIDASPQTVYFQSEIRNGRSEASIN